MPDRSDEVKNAFTQLGIPPDNRVILCLDGGGIRGILTLQLLKRIEALAGCSCCNIFDMVSGTSTGGIIAGLIAMGKNITQIEDLYKKLVTKVFTRKGVFANRFANPPEYSKKNYRSALKNEAGDITLQQCCDKTSIDLLITSKDVAAGEETFFSCFEHEDNPRRMYKDVLLRSVMEATMSAPTYFTSLERFVDGGTTTYNNPSMAAIMEAVHYGPKGKYDLQKLTVFSLGTGTTVEFVNAASVANPKGIDTKFWLNWILGEASQDASDMQMDIMRNILVPLGVDFRRFQISLDPGSVGLLPNRDIKDLHYAEGDMLHDLTEEDLKGVELDDVNKFALMEQIGLAMSDYICSDKSGSNYFKKDLINEKKRDRLISVRGEIDLIKQQMSNPKWLDGFPD